MGCQFMTFRRWNDGASRTRHVPRSRVVEAQLRWHSTESRLGLAVGHGCVQGVSILRGQIGRWVSPSPLVFDSLPESVQNCFTSPDIDMLKQVVAAMDPDQCKCYFQQYIDCGL